jgi:hypothetical protein
MAAIEGYMREVSVIAMRKTKSGEKPADIRPMTLALTQEPTGVIALFQKDRCCALRNNNTSVCISADGQARGRYGLRATLMLTEKATLKPNLLVSTLAARAGSRCL